MIKIFTDILNILLISFTFISSVNGKISGLNTYIVVDLAVVNSQISNQSCPSGYIASSGCSHNCDLNYKVGGNYIYLCQKKKRFRNLTVNDKLISKIKVNYNSKNCGNLKLIDSDLNKKAGGEYVYLCYGTDEEDPSPITDVYIYIDGVNEVPFGYTCLYDNLNEGTKKYQKIYVCFKKDYKIPQFIGYSNIAFNTNNKSISEIKNTNEITYIDNDNSGGDSSQTIRREIIYNIERGYSFNFNETLTFITKLQAKIPIILDISEDIHFRSEFTQSESIKQTHFQNESNKVEYPCIAPARKHIMCKAFNLNYKVSIPYKLNIIYYYYDGSTEIEEYISELSGVMGTSIQFSICCIKGCDHDDNICSNDEINNNDITSGSCPENYGYNSNYNYYNRDQIVVSDLTVISSENKNISCPLGYEIINYGCEKYGCDINYFAGGNYIYFCQKKQKLRLMNKDERPVNSFNFLYNTKNCNSSLNFVNINLNDKAGGNNIYLCYGTLNNSDLNPIVDFMVYISGISILPDGYICSNNDLNYGTTKGRPTYLCYTTNYNYFLAKEESTNNFGFDLDIVSDLDIVYSLKKTISCPNGFEVVNRGCDINGCDLNYKAGGYYIYLCQKKIPFSKLDPGKKPINDFKIIYDKKNKNNLNLIDIDLNKGCGGDFVYLTYGYENDKPLAPIVDFFVYIENINTPPYGYECDSKSLNSETKGKPIYLCYIRNENLPKEISINNLDLYYDRTKKVSLGLPDKLDEIIVDSASITKTVSKSITEEKNIHKYFSHYTALDINFSYLSLLELGINFNYEFSNEEEWKFTSTKTISTQITCNAESRKKMMCIPFFTNYQINIPYKASITYVNYKGDILKSNDFYGTFEKVSASQISYKICCLEGCCTGNKFLDQNQPQCSNAKADILCSEIQNCFY